MRTDTLANGKSCPKEERMGKFDKFIALSNVLIALARLALLCVGVYILAHIAKSFQ